MHRRLGALTQVAMVSNDSSNSVVIRRDAADWPRWMLSYHGESLR